ncbi:MAG: mRNA surveillance protein pelota [Candidatus Anstonellaceae archaeon]
MQILKQNKAENLIELLPQNTEDLWHLSNIIEVGDKIEAVSFRTYQANEQTEKEKKKVVVIVEVEKTEFSKFTNHLRVSGKIVGGKPLEYLQLGSYHTIDLQPGYSVKIIKEWQNYHLGRIKKAIEDTKKPKLYILLMDEKKALFAKILGFGIEYSWEMEFKTTKKLDQKNFEKEKKQNYEEIEKKIEQLGEQNFTLLLAGPGFEAKNFFEYLKQKKNKIVSKIILEHCSYAEKSGVIELLKKGVVNKVIQEQQIAFELKIMEEFKTLLAKGSNKITYGYDNIKKALENEAIEKIVVLDSLLSTKEQIKQLVIETEKRNKPVYIFSSHSEAGEELKAFGGLIAFLRF